MHKLYTQPSMITWLLAQTSVVSALDKLKKLYKISALHLLLLMVNFVSAASILMQGIHSLSLQSLPASK